jgi:hypothetical protein
MIGKTPETPAVKYTTTGACDTGQTLGAFPVARAERGAGKVAIRGWFLP